MKQGDIHLVTLDPVVSEQAKNRPCVIVSTNMINEYANTVTIAPLSTKKRDKPFPFHIPHKKSIIKVEHVRTVDKSRLIKKTDYTPPKTLRKIKKALATLFDL